MSESFLCNICAENIDDLSKKVVLKCNPQHIFCYDCIFEWYFKNKSYTSSSSSGNMYKYATCPICQKDGGFLTLPEGKAGIENVHFPKKMQTSYVYKACDCVDKAHNGNYYTCHSSGSSVLSLNNPTKVINLCYHHKNVYQKGYSITIKENDKYETIESIYGKKQCVVTLKSGAQCNGNANPQKNGNYLIIEKDGTKYTVCKKHVDDFNTNKVLTIENKSIMKNNMDIFTNLCGSLLASGHLCKKVGNPKYNGKCGIHKDKTKDETSTGSTTENVNKEPPYSKIKSDYLELYDKLNDTLTLFKNNVTNSILETKIKYLENILENINDSIKNIGYVGYAVKNEAKNEITEVQFDMKANVDELKKGIDDFELLVNKIFKKEGKNEDEDKDIFEELNQAVNESKKELKIDLYNPEFKIDPHCNVKQKNGKLCANPAVIYYNLKCYKHHQDHYLKEKLTNNDNLFVIKKEKEKNKVKNK